MYARTCVCMCARVHVRASARKRALELLRTWAKVRWGGQWCVNVASSWA